MTRGYFRNITHDRHVLFVIHNWQQKGLLLLRRYGSLVLREPKGLLLLGRIIFWNNINIGRLAFWILMVSLPYEE